MVSLICFLLFFAIHPLLPWFSTFGCGWYSVFGRTGIQCRYFQMGNQRGIDTHGLEYVYLFFPYFLLLALLIFFKFFYSPLRISSYSLFSTLGWWVVFLHNYEFNADISKWNMGGKVVDMSFSTCTSVHTFCS